MVQFEVFTTAWGHAGLVARDGRLLATFLPDARERIRDRVRASWPEACESTDALPAFRRQLVEYFEGHRTRFDVALDLTEVPGFHRVVYEACRRVEFGTTVSYAGLAKLAGRPGAARAVGQAMSRNPLPLVVPCHRVLRADGSLGGFSSPQGLVQKRQLLALEGIECPVGPREAVRAATHRERACAPHLVGPRRRRHDRSGRPREAVV